MIIRRTKLVYTYILLFHTFSSLFATPWSILLYMDADNDLRRYAAKSIKQFFRAQLPQDIVHRSVQLIMDKSKGGVRFQVTPQRLVNKETVPLSNDNVYNITDAARWAFDGYDADHTMIIFWGFGQGIIDKPRQSFTNHELASSLKSISEEVLGGKKIGIVVFDASKMAMVEVADLIKDHAKIMIGSQSSILGRGFNYNTLLSVFKGDRPTQTNSTVHYFDFAKYIVEAYKITYQYITDWHALSALDLGYVSELNVNITQVASLLIQSIALQKDNSVTKAIQLSKNRKLCTSFYTSRFKDLDHLYSNLASNLTSFCLHDSKRQEEIRAELERLLTEGRLLIKKLVIANETGPELNHAAGVSIYFPEIKIQNAYYDVPFTTSTGWLDLIKAYMQA